MSDSAAPRKLGLIESFRGIAALLVVLFHAEITVARPKYFGVDLLQGVFVFGAHGVDFFFVLSGFIITYVHWKDVGHPERIGRYLRKRCLRIFPTLWVVSIPFIALSIAIGSEFVPSDPGPRLEVIASSLLLLPSSFPPVPVVLWTLKHEILFYLLFCLVFISGRIGAGVLLAWACACVFALVGNAELQSGLSQVLLSPYNIEFLVGVLCGMMVRKTDVFAPRALLLAGVAIFAVGAVVNDCVPPDLTRSAGGELPTSPLLVLLYAAGSALIVVGGAKLDLQGRGFQSRALLRLGAASYAIYLVHFPLISLGCKILRALGNHVDVSPAIAFLAVASVGVLGGMLFHFKVEAPMLASLNRH